MTNDATQHAKMTFVLKTACGFRFYVDPDDMPLLRGCRFYRSSGRDYIVVKFDGKLRYLHRVLKKAPRHLDVDHKNGDPRDCRQSNMRLATRVQNNRNRGVQSRSKSGIKGVRFRKGRWEATIRADAREFYLGRFDTAEAAQAAYAQAALKHHGEFARIA